jgi:ribose-phosphate pyrophosphokinase
MNPLIFALHGNEKWVGSFAEAMGAKIETWTQHRFPDGEFYLRIESAVRENSTILFSSLKDPDEKIIPLIFLSSTLRDLGAKKIILVAPYLAYLRQDARFQEGEGITSRYFAKIISECFDGMLTVDPHLHRYASLNEIYSIPTKVVRAAPKISEWIRTNISRPVIIGPDLESEQWVSEVAKGAGAPSVVLEKTRKGDRDVEVHFPPLDAWQGHTPVIVDDIISSAKTMIATVDHLTKMGLASPVCIGVHAIFAGNSYKELLAAGAGEIVTCNTIAHPSNQIDLSRILDAAVKDFLPL